MTEEKQNVVKSLELFYDVETSGFISSKKDFDDPEQAWAVQLAAILSTKDKIITELDVLIKPNGRKINSHAEAIHGISLTRAQEEGIEEVKAIGMFANLLVDEPLKVCHNAFFDSQFIYQMFQRNIESLDDKQRSRFYVDIPQFCTMKDKNIMHFVGAKNKNGKLKWPKLSELYEKLFSCNFPDAHNALADVKALRDCYYELKKKGIIK